MCCHRGDCDPDFDLGSFVLLLTDSCMHLIRFFSVVQFTGYYIKVLINMAYQAYNI